MVFVERKFRDRLGALVIQSRMNTKFTDRGGLEKAMFPAIEVGLPGWQRAHSQGAGTGTESESAIRYAPAEVNLIYQNSGIERYIRDLLSIKPEDTELWLTTITSTHPRSLRLKEIQYRVDAVKGPMTSKLFEASIEIEDKKLSPRVTINATPFNKLF